jgi:uncharacterized protein (TIGR03067 family)
MRAFLLLAVLFPALPDRPNPAPKTAPKTIHEQILGDWEVVKVTIGNGIDSPMNEMRTVRFVAKEIQVFVNGESKPDDGGEYVLDDSKKPIAIDLMVRNGPQMKVEGIIELTGNQLTICFSIGGSRPTSFTSAGDNPQPMLHLKRVKR